MMDVDSFGWIKKLGVCLLLNPSKLHCFGNNHGDKYQKPHVFGSKVIYNIYKDLLRVLRY